jgi:hypothetical protein
VIQPLTMPPPWPAGVVLPSLRVRGGSGEADDNRRSEYPMCSNTNEQEDGDHDRGNEVFHVLSLVRRTGAAAS